MRPAFQVSAKREKERYEEHNNNVEDQGYQNFVREIVNAVVNDFSSSSDGLDFGSGTGPVASKLLLDQGYNIQQYDPYFADFPHLLEQTWSYIICCEVIEHFNQPEKSFALLKNLLKPSGKLYCKTYPYNEKTDFDNWFYIDDETHVFFYARRTFEYIKDKFSFSDLRVDGRLIVFTA